VLGKATHPYHENRPKKKGRKGATNCISCLEGDVACPDLALAVERGGGRGRGGGGWGFPLSWLFSRLRDEKRKLFPFRGKGECFECEEKN